MLQNESLFPFEAIIVDRSSSHVLSSLMPVRESASRTVVFEFATEFGVVLKSSKEQNTVCTEDCAVYDLSSLQWFEYIISPILFLYLLWEKA